MALALISAYMFWTVFIHFLTKMLNARILHSSYDLQEVEVVRVADVLYGVDNNGVVNETLTSTNIQETDHLKFLVPVCFVVGACLGTAIVLVLCLHSNTCYFKDCFA